MKKMIAVILAAAMIIGVTACGSSQSQMTTDAGPSGGAVSEDAGTAIGRTKVTVGLANTVSSLGPFQGTGLYYQFVMGQIYQRLGQRTDYDSQEFEPILMTEYTKVDPVTYDITIRDNVYDSNGIHLTADDVAWCFNYVKENSLSGYAYIDHAEATGDYTLTLTVAKEDLGTFEYACEAVYIVTQESYEASDDGMATVPVGTGPYTATEFVTGSKVVLERLDDFWGDQAEDKDEIPLFQHNVDVIEFDFLTEGTQMSVALQTNAIQMGFWLDEAIVGECQTYDGLVVETLDNLQLCDILFNTTSDSPCNDVNLRKAIAYCANSQMVVDNVLRGLGSIPAAGGKPALKGYNDAWETEYDYYMFDQDKAKEYLAASNYNGEELMILIQSVALQRSLATVLQENMRSIGINSRIDEYDTSTRNIYVVAGNGYHYDLTLYNLSAQGAALIQTWNGWLDENRYDSGQNMFGYSDPKLQELVEACGAEDWTQDDYDALYEYVYDNCLLYQWYGSTYSYARREEIVVPDYARSALNGEMIIGALQYPDDWSYFE